ncbi:MAG: glycosyltransferase [Desulfobacteraceae bacterium]|nr:glycosyltransferase [Desulfobacteraceae bacterium]MBC2756767.1 glycosyltransferase [Desulfobacteraceae bacterium]
MKFVLIGPSYPFRGGIAHYTTLLNQYLQNRHDVRFFSFKRQYPQWLFPGKTDIDPSKENISSPGTERIIDSINPLSWVIAARKIIQSDPDIVIFPWWVSFWAPQFLFISLIVKQFCRAKILFICHNVVAHESMFFDKLLTGMVFRQGDFFVVHSGEDKRNLLQMIPGANVKKNVHPIYDVFKISTQKLKARNKKSGLTGHVLLFFGFVREYKGLKYLFEAMPEILKDMPATLMVVGEFWKDKTKYLDLIKSLAIEDHVVIVDEYIPNESVGEYFSAADVVVQPYVSATGSGVVQIAFGFNKPVIATNVGCLPEVVRDGETGYLIAPRSPSEIAEAVIKFFKENNGPVFSENIKKEKYRFSWDRLVDVIESFIPDKGPN